MQQEPATDTTPEPVGYVCAYSDDEQVQLQIDMLQEADCTLHFEESASGVQGGRPSLNQAIEIATNEANFVVWRLDRLGRTLEELIETVRLVDQSGVKLRFLRPCIVIDDSIDSINGIQVRSISFAGPHGNALSLSLMGKLQEAVDQSRDKVLIITSFGNAFSTGLDTKEIYANDSAKTHLLALRRLYESLIDHPLPTASLVHARALAGGVGLALCPSVTVANCQASLSLPGKPEYQPLAEVLYEVVVGCRPGVTRDIFDGWYKFPASALDLQSIGVVDDVTHPDSQASDMSRLVDSAIWQIRNALDSKYQRCKPSSDQWNGFDQQLEKAIEASESRIFLHSLWRQGLEKPGSRNKKSVFVVHGRNTAAKDSMLGALKALGLEPLDWNSMLAASPYKEPYFVVATGLAKAQAMVVLITGDNLSKLKEEFLSEEDRQNEEALSGQPRQNVLIEAGMGLGMCEQRTILIDLENCSNASDFAGLEWINVNSQGEWIGALRSQLLNAGCDLSKEDPRKLKTAVSVVKKVRKEWERTQIHA